MVVLNVLIDDDGDQNSTISSVELSESLHDHDTIASELKTKMDFRIPPARMVFWIRQSNGEEGGPVPRSGLAGHIMSNLRADDVVIVRDRDYEHHRKTQKEVDAILQLNTAQRYKSLGRLSGRLRAFRSVHTLSVSWAVFDEASIAAIARFLKSHGVRSVLELFAGRGLLARLLSSMLEESSDGGAGPSKISVRAVDDRSTHGSQRGTEYFPIEHEDAVGAAAASDADALIYCWAPNKNEATAAAFQEFKGDYFIHIGEGEFGCTDTPRFFEILDSDWALLSTHLNPTFDGFHDCISFYCRKGSM